MRGNPVLRAILLVIALGLTSVLVASVLGLSKSPVTRPTPAPAPRQPASSLTAAFINVTLSAPAESFTFTEPSGRVIELPPGDSLQLAHFADLAIDPATATWDVRLSIEWQDPTRHHFARIDLEPHQLETVTLVLDFPGNVTNFPLTATFPKHPPNTQP